MTTDETLQAFFDAGRGGPAPSERLYARILSDAGAALPQPVPAAVPAPRPGLWTTLVAAFGWPALAGMATAAMAGLWLGFAAPDTVDGIGQADWAMGEMMPSFDLASGL